MLQEGIYHEPGKRPGRHFGLAFLRAERPTTAGVVGGVLLGLWRMYQDLKRGVIRDLPDTPVPPSDGLTVLLGYGRNAFELTGARLDRAPLPELLKGGASFLSPRSDGGGPLLRGAGLDYALDVADNVATEDFAVQFIADSEFSVDRAIVETWKFLADASDPDSRRAPVTMSGYFRGFGRDDGRSWLDFHDGVSNLRSELRDGVISIDPGEPPWIVGGTYMCFLRLAVDLPAWRGLDRTQQELLVGRDKLTGCPLVSVTADGVPVPVEGCPVPGTTTIFEPGNEAFREPGAVTGTALIESHVQRANHRAGDPSNHTSGRVFRQGFEFLEPMAGRPGFRAGLNFVSFQDDPRRLITVLTQPGWLGDTNFGGAAGAASTRLLSVRAAGVYLVPPAVPDGMPGQELFPTR